MFSFLYLTNPLLVYRSVIFCGFLPSDHPSFLASNRYFVAACVAWGWRRGIIGTTWMLKTSAPTVERCFGRRGFERRVLILLLRKMYPISYFIFEREMLEEESGKGFWEMHLANHNQSTTGNSKIVFENKFQPSFPNNKYQLQLLFF